MEGSFTLKKFPRIEELFFLADFECWDGGSEKYEALGLERDVLLEAIVGGAESGVDDGVWTEVEVEIVLVSSLGGPGGSNAAFRKASFGTYGCEGLGESVEDMEKALDGSNCTGSV